MEPMQDRSPAGVAAAWMVHLLTASGAFFGLLALRATAEGAFVAALAWMAVTVAIDGVDGALARRGRVKHFLPHFDGALLDNMVDYFTYVLVPAYFLLHVEIAPPPWRLPLAAAMILSSAYQFCRDDAKTPDHAFTGFPSYWNVLVFYLYMLHWPVGVNILLTLLCALGVFVPIRYLYPTRTPFLRPVNIGLGLLWAALLLAALQRYPIGHETLMSLSFFYIVYYLAFSIWLTTRRALAQRRGV